MKQNLNDESSFVSVLIASWALLFGIGILMLGDGLQGTLLAVRADMEGFSASQTGLIMSAFFMGFLGGSFITPKLVDIVGHIRTFAALSALASAAILIHAVFVDSNIWIGLRLVSGFCFAGLSVVAESWLNERANNRTRGKILSLYMIVTYIGAGLGQLSLNLASPKGFQLFILISVVISIAVIPLLLSAGSPPKTGNSVRMKLKDIFRLSPFGCLGVFVVGFASAGFFSIGPVYATRIGLDLEFISYFLVSAVIGTVILQWPIGALSDRYDRRTVIAIVTFLAGVSAILCGIYASYSLESMFVLVGLYGGLSLPLYSLCLAYINDRLEPNQMVAASGSLILINGLGSILGPIMVSLIMEQYGTLYFFISLGCVLFSMSIFAIIRMKKRKASPSKAQNTVIQASLHPLSTFSDYIGDDESEEGASK